MVEHLTVNQGVVSSSLTSGVAWRVVRVAEGAWLETMYRGFTSIKGSNPLLSVDCKWPVGQVVKTPPFHGGNMGSNPVRVTYRHKWRISSVGRASALQAEGHRFEPCILHFFVITVPWSSWLGRLPVTQEITSSSLVGTVPDALTTGGRFLFAVEL